MEIEVDFNPTPSEIFFISVGISEDEAVSFDYTTKAHRIVKQKLIEKEKFPKGGKIDGEWDALIFENGEFVKKYHVKWIDMGEKDWCNDEIWEIVEEKPLSKELTEKLLEYSRYLSDNYKNIDKRKMDEFESLIKRQVEIF